MSAGGGDADFSTGAELTLSLPDRELSAIRSKIENELSDIPIGVDASGVGGSRRQPRDPSTGRFMSIEGVEQRIIEQTDLQVELLDDIKDAVEGGGGGGAGGLAAGALLRGGLPFIGAGAALGGVNFLGQRAGLGNLGNELLRGPGGIGAELGSAAAQALVQGFEPPELQVPEAWPPELAIPDAPAWVRDLLNIDQSGPSFDNQTEIRDVFENPTEPTQRGPSRDPFRGGPEVDPRRGMDEQTARQIIENFPRGAISDPLAGGEVRVDNRVDVTVEDRSGMDEREVERKVSDEVADLERRLNDLFRNQ